MNNNASNGHSKDEIDSDAEQQVPMMPQSSYQTQPSIPNENMEKQEPVAPTGFLAWVGFGCTIFGLACICISFASPYWIQTYPDSFNTFRNIGLWEVCMSNYMHHKDDSQELYRGCWWVFNSETKYRKLREWLLPPWLIAVQVLVTGCLTLFIATALTIAFVFLHFCPIMNHEYHQTYALFASAAMMFLTTLGIFVSGTVYGQMSQDREWMPNPQFNFLSWGYGFLIMAGIASISAGVCFYLEAKKAYEELIRREMAFAKNILEMTGYAPSEKSDRPPSYPGSYPSESEYDNRYPSYDQGYLPPKA